MIRWYTQADYANVGGTTGRNLLSLCPAGATARLFGNFKTPDVGIKSHLQRVLDCLNAF